MSKRPGGLFRVIFWTYGRGTWQYDILCLLILAFIFLTPKDLFDGSYFVKGRGAERSARIESSGGDEQVGELSEEPPPR